MPDSPTPALSPTPSNDLPSAGTAYGIRDLAIVAGFLVCYLLLDWISFAEPFGRFGITPWEPASGLSIALVLLTGKRHVWLLPLAPMLAETFVRGMSMPVTVMLATSLAIGGTYAIAGLVLREHMLRSEGPLITQRNVLLLVVILLAASLIVSLAEVGLLSANRLIVPSDLMLAILREWVGEFIGAAVTTPFVVLLVRGRLTLSWLMVLPLATIAGVLALIFIIPQATPLQLFYLLFVPMIWMALVHGLEGTVIAALATQLGLVLALNLADQQSTAMLPCQLLMIVLAVTGLLTGAVVSDRERAAVRLLMLQEAQARFNRLGSMGALSAVLAHEIRQPLSAAATYARLAREALPEGKPELTTANDHLQKSTVQIQRASDILQHMHELVVVGRSELAPVGIQKLIEETVELMQSELQRSQVKLVLAMEPGLPRLACDAQQIGQVIINLVDNAVEAMPLGGQITISARRAGADMITVSVSDTGPGFGDDQLRKPITPLATTKADGLGLGLALCETILHNHGGKMRIANSPRGAIVEFTLKQEAAGDEK